MLAFFPENNWAKAAFVTVGIITFIIAYVCHGKTPPKVKSKTQNKPLKTQQKPLELSPDHISALRVFRANDGELISTPLIEQSTGLETIVINSILADLKRHNLIHATNLDDLNGGWQYQLSDKGRKLIIKTT